jgi:hypothetical protein
MLPALALATSPLVISPLAGQSRVVRDAVLLPLPTASSTAIGSAFTGALLAPDRTKDAFTHVILEGWIDIAMLGGKVDTFPRSVKAEGARLRAAGEANGKVVARLRKGTGLMVEQTSGQWIKVRRAAWVKTALLGPALPSGSRPLERGEVRAVPASAGSRAPLAMASDASAGAVAVPDGAMLPGPKGAELRTAPDGRALAQVRAGAVLTPLAREKGWVRVRLEGWVPEKDIVPADSSLRSGLSAADLRADPQGTRGTIVRWEIEVMGLQTADPLRRDLSDGEPYLLARGPAGEEALLYVAVPPSLLAEARTLAPLTKLLITARVRTGRSEPTGVPVLDLQTLSRK